MTSSSYMSPESTAMSIETMPSVPDIWDMISDDVNYPGNDTSNLKRKNDIPQLVSLGSSLIPITKSTSRASNLSSVVDSWMIYENTSSSNSNSNVVYQSSYNTSSDMTSSDFSSRSHYTETSEHLQHPYRRTHMNAGSKSNSSSMTRNSLFSGNSSLSSTYTHGKIDEIHNWLPKVPELEIDRTLSENIESDLVMLMKSSRNEKTLSIPEISDSTNTSVPVDSFLEKSISRQNPVHTPPVHHSGTVLLPIPEHDVFFEIRDEDDIIHQNQDSKPIRQSELDTDPNDIHNESISPFDPLDTPNEESPDCEDIISINNATPTQTAATIQDIYNLQGLEISNQSTDSIPFSISQSSQSVPLRSKLSSIDESSTRKLPQVKFQVSPDSNLPLGKDINVDMHMDKTETNPQGSHNSNQGLNFCPSFDSSGSGSMKTNVKPENPDSNNHGHIRTYSTGSMFSVSTMPNTPLNANTPANLDDHIDSDIQNSNFQNDTTKSHLNNLDPGYTDITNVSDSSPESESEDDLFGNINPRQYQGHSLKSNNSQSSLASMGSLASRHSNLSRRHSRSRMSKNDSPVISLIHPSTEKLPQIISQEYTNPTLDPNMSQHESISSIGNEREYSSSPISFHFDRNSNIYGDTSSNSKKHGIPGRKSRAPIPHHGSPFSTSPEQAVNTNSNKKRHTSRSSPDQDFPDLYETDVLNTSLSRRNSFSSSLTHGFVPISFETSPDSKILVQRRNSITKVSKELLLKSDITAPFFGDSLQLSVVRLQDDEPISQSEENGNTFKNDSKYYETMTSKSVSGPSFSFSTSEGLKNPLLLSEKPIIPSVSPSLVKKHSKGSEFTKPTARHRSFSFGDRPISPLNQVELTNSNSMRDQHRLSTSSGIKRPKSTDNMKTSTLTRNFPDKMDRYRRFSFSGPGSSRFSQILSPVSISPIPADSSSSNSNAPKNTSLHLKAPRPSIQGSIGFGQRQKARKRRMSISGRIPSFTQPKPVVNLPATLSKLLENKIGTPTNSNTVGY